MVIQNPPSLCATDKKKREAKFITTDQSRNKKEGPHRVQAEQRLNTASRVWQ